MSEHFLSEGNRKLRDDLLASIARSFAGVPAPDDREVQELLESPYETDHWIAERLCISDTIEDVPIAYDAVYVLGPTSFRRLLPSYLSLVVQSAVSIYEDEVQLLTAEVFLSAIASARVPKMKAILAVLSDDQISTLKRCLKFAARSDSPLHRLALGALRSLGSHIQSD